MHVDKGFLFIVCFPLKMTREGVTEQQLFGIIRAPVVDPSFAQWVVHDASCCCR